LDDLKMLENLRRLPASITELSISFNQVARMRLFRTFVAYRLRNIAVVNGVRVTDSERLKGHRLFSSGVQQQMTGDSGGRCVFN
jgi:hypothetical protein